MRSLIFILGFCFMLLGCADDKSDFGSQPSAPARQLELTRKERAQTLGNNELFIAVFNNSPSEVEKIISQKPGLLYTENGYGDTALGFALKLGFRDCAAPILNVTQVKQLLHVNHLGEGYIFLASKIGYVEAITQIADRYYNSLGGFEGYSFSDLDLPNNDGQRALFVAADRAVAEALETQYYRGRFNMPGYAFMLARDNKWRTFLHTAAQLGHNDVILWASERICRQTGWFRGAVINEIQSYTVIGRLSLPTTALFNHQDSDYKTALHTAIEYRQWDSVRALGNCRWLDYDLADADGDLPLHSFLKTINHYRTDSSPEVHETFNYLLNQDTLSRRLLTKTVDRINTADKEGNTALHLAALLADPYFYKTLVDHGGDTDAQNESQHIKASNLFKQRQNEVLQHGR